MVQNLAISYVGRSKPRRGQGQGEAGVGEAGCGGVEPGKAGHDGGGAGRCAQGMTSRLWIPTILTTAAAVLHFPSETTFVVG